MENVNHMNWSEKERCEEEKADVGESAAHPAKIQRFIYARRKILTREKIFLGRRVNHLDLGVCTGIWKPPTM